MKVKWAQKCLKGLSQVDFRSLYGDCKSILTPSDKTTWSQAVYLLHALSHTRKLVKNCQIAAQSAASCLSQILVKQFFVVACSVLVASMSRLNILSQNLIRFLNYASYATKSYIQQGQSQCARDMASYVSTAACGPSNDRQESNYSEKVSWMNTVELETKTVQCFEFDEDLGEVVTDACKITSYQAERSDVPRSEGLTNSRCKRTSTELDGNAYIKREKKAKFGVLGAHRPRHKNPKKRIFNRYHSNDWIRYIHSLKSRRFRYNHLGVFLSRKTQSKPYFSFSPKKVNLIE